MVKKTDILKIIIKNKAEEITERRKNINTPINITYKSVHSFFFIRTYSL